MLAILFSVIVPLVADFCPAQLFTRLVAEFKLLIINTPESVIEGRITTKGRIEYLFMAFGSLAMLFIEVKYRLNTGDEFLDAVAQVIAEADGMFFILSLDIQDLD